MAGSETLSQVREEFFRTVGPTTLRAIVLAGALGAVTLVVAHQGWEVPVETGVLLALLVAFTSFAGILIRAVGRLETRSKALQGSLEVLNQRLGAHFAIAAWVSNCEVSLDHPEGSGLTREQRVPQELELLEANSASSLKYPFYSPDLTDRIHELATGDGQQSKEERLAPVRDLARHGARTLHPRDQDAQPVGR